VGNIPAEVTRAASFYVPEVARGALPSLPPKQGSTLTAACRLGAIWYEARGLNLSAGLASQLTAAWGVSSQSTRAERVESLAIRGSGRWKDLALWRRGNVNVWLAWTDWDKGDGVGSRTIIWMIRDRPRDLDLFAVGFDTAGSALKLASPGPALTADIKPERNCATWSVAAGLHGHPQTGVPFRTALTPPNPPVPVVKLEPLASEKHLELFTANVAERGVEIHVALVTG
jgi:hypothetical protein